MPSRSLLKDNIIKFPVCNHRNRFSADCSWCASQVGMSIIMLVE